MLHYTTTGIVLQGILQHYAVRHSACYGRGGPWSTTGPVGTPVAHLYGMKIAIPHWQGRVSPVFDVAEHLLVVELDDRGMELSRVQADLRAESPHHRAAQVAETGAEVLICGAISWPMETALAALGVRIIAQPCGNIEEVLAGFVRGRLSDGAFAMPGCCGRRRRGQGRGRGRCRGGRHGPPC